MQTDHGRRRDDARELESLITSIQSSFFERRRGRDEVRSIQSRLAWVQSADSTGDDAAWARVDAAGEDDTYGGEATTVGPTESIEVSIPRLRFSQPSQRLRETGVRRKESR